MELHPTVMGFFHGAVTDALRSQGVEATEPTEFYLVNLLCEFTDASRVTEEPLALRMAQLAVATPDERVRTLKEIGDTSLYMSGFFADNLARRLVDVDYYIQLGGSAYGQLAGLITTTRGSATDFFQQAFVELSAKFARFVEVLNEVRRSTSIAGGGNLLRLYEEWVRTGSEWLERRLRESGLFALDAFKPAKPSS